MDHDLIITVKTIKVPKENNGETNCDPGLRKDLLDIIQRA